jgi:hypothetical protein
MLKERLCGCRDLEEHHTIIEQLQVGDAPFSQDTSSCEAFPAQLASSIRLAMEYKACNVTAAQVDWMLATELLIDLFFLADIALNFNTGYILEQARDA